MACLHWSRWTNPENRFRSSAAAPNNYHILNVDGAIRLPVRAVPIIRTNVLLSGSGGIGSSGHRAANLFNPDPERRAATRLGQANRRTSALSSGGEGTAG